MSERTSRERPETIRGHKFIRLKGGRMLTFWDAVSDVERARTDLGRAFSRTFKLAREEWDMERVEWLVESLEDYAVALRVHLESNRGTQTVRERIALLRNTDGRTLEEAETFRAKADELERRLDK